MAKKLWVLGVFLSLMTGTAVAQACQRAWIAY
jgi:hypothetical protein